MSWSAVDRHPAADLRAGTQLPVPRLRQRAGADDAVPARGPDPRGPNPARAARTRADRGRGARRRPGGRRPGAARRCPTRPSTPAARCPTGAGVDIDGTTLMTAIRDGLGEADRQHRPGAARRRPDGPVRRSGRGQPGQLHHPAGRHRQPDRAQRRRQDDVLQRAHRALPAGRGARCMLGRPGHHRPAAAQDRGAGAGPDLPEHPAVRPDDGRGERHGGDAPAPASPGCSARSCGLPWQRREERAGPRRRRWSCSTSSASARPPGSTPATSPTATSAGWRWRGRWPCARRCCCSTSRPPA